MNDEQLLRYSRHILLPEIDLAGQEAILASSALIVGAGGLGSPAAMYLASAGVGRLMIADHDTVDTSNLQRQILHREATAGLPKVESARLTLLGINPGCEIETIAQRLAAGLLEEKVRAASVVLDCSDNFETRHAINRACFKFKKPLVSGSAIRFTGQVSVFDLRESANPCYDCLFPEGEAAEDVRCAVTGVFAPLTGIVGAIQAAEALKLLSGCGDPLLGRLLLIDGLTMKMREVRYGKDPACGVCAQA